MKQRFHSDREFPLLYMRYSRQLSQHGLAGKQTRHMPICKLVTCRYADLSHTDMQNLRKVSQLAVDYAQGRASWIQVTRPCVCGNEPDGLECVCGCAFAFVQTGAACAFRGNVDVRTSVAASESAGSAAERRFPSALVAAAAASAYGKAVF